MNKTSQVYANGYDAVNSLRVASLLRGIADAWQDQYLTYAVFAEHNNMTEKQAETLLTLARDMRKTNRND